jgi:hypothetical protein
MPAPVGLRPDLISYGATGAERATSVSVRRLRASTAVIPMPQAMANAALAAEPPPRSVAREARGRRGRCRREPPVRHDRRSADRARHAAARRRAPEAELMRMRTLRASMMPVLRRVLRRGDRSLELIFRHVDELLPFRRLVSGDAEIGEGGSCRTGRPVPGAMLVATRVAATLRLLHPGEQLTGLALGTQPDLAGAPPCPVSL